MGVEKPHALCFPLPCQGHINPMLKLATILHSHGYRVTFILTEFDYGRLLRSSGPSPLTVSSDDFKFETIPDGLPPPSEEDYSRNRHTPSLCDFLAKKGHIPLRDLLTRTQDRVSLVVWDGLLTFVGEVAAELGIVDVMFWTSSACSLLGFFHFPQLIERGLVPLKDESYLTNGFLDTEVDWIPGMKGICLKDLPTLFQTTNLDDILFNFSKDAAQGSLKASAIILNTIEDLETEVVNELARILPPIYTVGPVSMLCKHVPDSSTFISSMPSSMWKEDATCIDWLDKRQPKSVLYVNFGSMATLSVEQMVEFAWGLASSDNYFLWVIRPDLVEGGKSVLAQDQEFVAMTQERCLTVNWCPQQKVLAHPSVGAFLTHCGWNSMLEGISAGVPLICWQFFADQSTNCYYACNKWGIGVEIGKNVKRENVKDIIQEVMEGEKGIEMRKNAIEWKERAEKAVDDGGSSCLSATKLFADLAKK